MGPEAYVSGDSDDMGWTTPAKEQLDFGSKVSEERMTEVPPFRHFHNCKQDMYTITMVLYTYMCMHLPLWSILHHR